MSENTSSEATSQNEGPTSLRDALLESFDEHTGAESTSLEATGDQQTDDEPNLSTSEEQEAQGEPSEEQSQGEPKVIPAPEHWSDEDKATFTELPAQAQSYLLKRETQYEQGIQQKADELNPLTEAFGPYEEILKLRGVDRPTAIRTWVAAQSALDQDPVAGLKMLIQTYGPEVAAKLMADIGHTGAVDDDRYVDPEVKDLREQLAAQKRQTNQSQQQFAHQRQQDAILQVKAFKEEVDDKGELAHPFFDEAQDTMRALLTNGTVADLGEAYDKAIWSIPEYREHVNKQTQSALEKKESANRNTAAARAQKTAKAVNGKGSKPPPQAVKNTMRDDLVEAFEQSARGELNG